MDNYHKNIYWIDNASYYDLLYRWRFSENDPIFHGETGKYYAKIMNEKKNQLTQDECVRISKLIGWTK